MKIIINVCYGGFELTSSKLKELGSTSIFGGEEYRTDPRLIQAIEDGEDVTDETVSKLQIIEIPDNSYYVISNYDGIETVYYSASDIKEI